MSASWSSERRSISSRAVSLALARIHAHVDRAFAAEAHSAGRVVELGRAHAEVGADPGDLLDAERVERLGDPAEGRLHEGHAIAEALEATTCGIERDLVAIERDDARLGMGLEDCLGVSATADGRVDVDARARRERLGHFGLHHCRVDEVGHLGLLSRFVRPYPLGGCLGDHARKRELPLSAAHSPSSARRALICSRSSSVVSKCCFQACASQSSAYLPLPAQSTSFTSFA